MWKYALGAVAALWGVSAAAENFVCAMKPDFNTHLVAPEIRVMIDGNTATVFDGLIAMRHAGPVPGRLTRVKPTLLEVIWEVEVNYKGNRTSQGDYRIRIDTARGNRARLRAHIPGEFNEVTGRGACRMAK